MNLEGEHIMILERYFQKRKDLKTAKTWMKALETREVQKNSFHQSGDLKQAREFAEAVVQTAIQPQIQAEIVEEKQIEPTVIFTQDMLQGLKPAVALG
jgi:hypothetical protein